MVREQDLDAWVQKTDELGGIGAPGVAEYWDDFSYEPTVAIDTSLDPDSPEYRAQMLELYRELSGRSLDQHAHEQTELDVDHLVGATSPYDGAAPGDRALHYLRTARVVRHAGLAAGSRILDMGCGWGLTCEFLTQLGFDVVAVDINPKFVQLVQRRADRLGLPIHAVCSGFDDFEAELESFDGVLFYESLHHAVDVRSLVSRVAPWLKPGAPIMLAGEPIQRTFWPSWGLRLDAESVYCIRKFGWFESGWSRRYLSDVFASSDLLPKFYRDADPAVGLSVIASTDWVLPAAAMAGPLTEADWSFDGTHLVSSKSGDRSILRIWKPASARTVTFELMNQGSMPLPLRVSLAGARHDISLQRGSNEITLDCDGPAERLTVRFTAPEFQLARVSFAR